MKFRNTLIAFIVLLALGGYIFLFEKGKSPQDAEEREKILLEINGQELTGLELTSNESTIACTRGENGIWQINVPLPTPADKENVEKLIADLKDLKAVRIIKEDIGDWNNYGLDKPEVKLTVLQKNKGPVILCFGHKNPAGTAVYSRVTEKNILYLIPAWKKDNLKKTLFDLRDKTVISLSIQEVKKIELFKQDKEPILISKTADNKWHISSPLSTRADENNIAKLLIDLTALKAKEFIDEPQEDISVYGLDKPYFKLVLGLGQDLASETIIIGNKADKEGTGQVNRKYAQRVGNKSVFLIEDTDIDNINKELFDLRYKRSFDLENTDRVDKLEIVYPDQKIVCRKTNTENEDSSPLWEIITADNQRLKADTASVNIFIWSLQELEAKEFVAETGADSDLPAYGLDNPQIKVALYSQDQEAPQVLIVGKSYEPAAAKTQSDSEKNSVYAKNSLLPAVFLLDSGKTEKLKKTVFDLKDKKIFGFERDQIHKIELIYPEQTLVCLKKTEDKWQLTQLEKAPVNSNIINDILWELENLGYISEPIGKTETLNSYGLDKPAVKIVLSDKKDKPLNSLSLGKTTENGEPLKIKAYAQVGGSSIIYQVDETKITTFTKSVSDLKE